MLSLVQVRERIGEPSKRGPERKIKVGLGIVSKILSVAKSLTLINPACAEYVVLIASGLRMATPCGAIRTIGPSRGQGLRFRAYLMYTADHMRRAIFPESRPMYHSRYRVSTTVCSEMRVLGQDILPVDGKLLYIGSTAANTQ